MRIRAVVDASVGGGALSVEEALASLVEECRRSGCTVSVKTRMIPTAGKAPSVVHSVRVPLGTLTRREARPCVLRNVSRGILVEDASLEGALRRAAQTLAAETQDSLNCPDHGPVATKEQPWLYRRHLVDQHGYTERGDEVPT